MSARHEFCPNTRAALREHQAGEVRGQGLLVSLDLCRDIANQAVDLARGKGLLINARRPDTLRFMPALTVTDTEIDRVIAILDTVPQDLRPTKATA